MSDPTRDVSARPEPHAEVPPNLDTRSTGESTDISAHGEVRAPGLVVPGYELKAELGRGGMGIVYRAHDTRLNRDVAVKVLLDRYAPDSSAATRFVQEARITGQLQHPGIPPIHEVGNLPDGRPFIAMKLIKGQTLQDLLPDRANLRGMLIASFEQLCQAVGYAHSHGVIHRDLKPLNVMIGAFGEVQVMDWGLAKFRSESRPATPGSSQSSTFYDPREDSDEGSKTRAGAFLGTPAYMPPEQAIGAVDRVDERSDVFGLGGILCAILTGEPPYLGADSESTRQLAAQGKVAPAFNRLDACGGEPELIVLCKRCLAVEPENRPKNGGEVARAVAEFRATAADRARQAELDQATAQLRVIELKKRRRIARAFAAAVILALVAGGVATFIKYRDEAAQRAVAEDEKRTADRERAAAQAETAAKEQALRQLNEQQAAKEQVLRQLTEQQAATEEALVRGILRPLRSNAGEYNRYSQLTADEARALVELGRLPERLQFRFVEVALTTPGGPEKVQFRGRAIAHSITVLDRNRAIRLRAAVHRWFAASLGGDTGRLACIAVVLALPGEPEGDASLAEYLADRLLERANALGESALQTLLNRLDRTRAAAIVRPRFRAVADRISDSKTAKAEARRLVTLLAMLARKLERDEVAPLAGPAARAMAARASEGEPSSQIDERATYLESLLEWLDPTEAADVVRPVLKAAAKRLTAGGNRAYLERIADASVFQLAKHLSPMEAEAFLQELSGWFADSVKSTDPYRAMTSTMVLVLLADRLPPDRKSALLTPQIGWLSERLIKDPNNPFASTYAILLAQIAEKLPRGEAAKALSPAARALAAKLSDPSDDAMTMMFPMALDPLLNHLDPAEAKALGGRVAKSLFERIAKPGARTAFMMLGNNALLANRLDPADAANAARALSGRIAVENDPKAFEHLLNGMTALVPYLDAKSSDAVSKAIATRLAKEKNPELAAPLAQLAVLFARQRSDTELLQLLKQHGSEPTITAPILSEFSRRTGRRGAPLQAVVGFVVVAVPPFESVWELAEWGEKNRTDLDFRSPPDTFK